MVYASRELERRFNAPLANVVPKDRSYEDNTLQVRISTMPVVLHDMDLLLRVLAVTLPG